MHSAASDDNGLTLARGAAPRDRWTHVPGWLSAAAVPAVATVVILASAWWPATRPPSGNLRSRLAGELLLAEVVLLVVWAPLMGLFTATRVWPSGDTLAGRSRAARILDGTWQLGRHLVIRVGMMTALSLAIMLETRAPIDAVMLVRTHAILSMAALAFAATGALCARMFREPLDAAACATATALFATFALFTGGPAIDSVPRWLLDAALVVNPIVAMEASANIDIFRTDLVYQLSPLAHRQIDYPAFSTALGAYALIALALLVLSARQFSTWPSAPRSKG